jgi:meso-butanediol dehydrogenase / (S,S)-butanediol dehydrogenase / diacetyl reductase
MGCGGHWMGRLDGKTVLVVDADAPLGQAAAVLFAREGAAVFVGEREAGAAGATLAAPEGNGKGQAIALDPTDDTSCERAVSEIVRTAGQLDILCNRAPDPPRGRKLLHDTSVGEWDAAYADAVTAVVLPTRAALRAMRSRGGSLILIGSSAALVGVPGMAAYSGCVGSLVNLTRVLAVDGAADRVRANCVCLGTLDELVGPPPTEAHAAARAPIWRAGDRPPPPADELAPLLLFLASDESRHVTGQVIAADAGLTAWR